jgi:hypothetical protein
LETEGLNPEIHSIEQIGIRTNKGFERVISIEGDTRKEKNANELMAIREMLAILSKIKPDLFRKAIPIFGPDKINSELQTISNYIFNGRAA